MIFGAIGDLIGTYFEQDAERKAIHAQEDALKALKPLDVDKLDKETYERDKRFYSRAIDTFREQNPELAEAREITQRGLRRSLEDVEGEFARTEQLLEQRITEAGKPSPVAEEIRNTLLVQTRDNLNRGAQLPPEFQAELVRTGLEAASASGVGGAKQGPVTQRLGTLLGAAGLELESRRRAEAAQAVQLEDALTRSRQQILGDLVSQSSSLPGAKTGFYGTTLAGLEGMVQPVGLTGRDLLNLDLANTDFEREKILGMGGLSAQMALSQGKAHAAYSRKGGQLVDSVIMAAAGGGAGGMLGGMMGGGGASGALGGNAGGGMFSSLFGGGAQKSTVSSPLYGSVTGYDSGNFKINRTPFQQQQFDYAQARYQ
jgi:hypothetical protein